jgi:hypothetical protein
MARLHADYAALPVIQPQLQRMHAAYTAKPEAKCGDCQRVASSRQMGRADVRGVPARNTQAGVLVGGLDGVRDVGGEAMSRPRMKPIKPIGRDKTGVLIPTSAFDSLMANDAAWRALLRLPWAGIWYA